MIEVNNIEKSFGTLQVLKGVSARFESGKCNLIIGKSGSGKTVFLKNMVGLLTPDVGDIMYDGRSFNNMSKQERKEIRREIGMLFQGSALFDSMTVEDNIKFTLYMFSTMTEK
jgi:phospholipid/cholesterol/gamma-HCH transport system ATP-binding protein